MLGWEFPPVITGGLGMACYGLTKAMAHLGVQITFVLPKLSIGESPGHVRRTSTQGEIKIEELSEFENVSFHTIASTLRPYACAGSQSASQRRKENLVAVWRCRGSKEINNYGENIYQEVYRYAAKAAEIASVENFDIVHAHDWMTFPAGITIAKASAKPLIVHIHSTEFDRSGEHVNQTIYDIEREGMHKANKVIAVSNYTKSIIVSRYGIGPEKVEVVYNAIDPDNHYDSRLGQSLPDRAERIVLFLGRLTMQKGPEYFLAAAKKVLEKVENVKFVMVGAGDMMHRAIEMAAQMGIGHKVIFTGFLQGDDVSKIYRMADIYVMPSVSEPFGIASLEALSHQVPVLISKHSGAAEVLTHALKVDFWDINQMANKIIAVLKHGALRTSLQENGYREISKFRWEDSAAKVINIYEQTLALSAYPAEKGSF